MVHPCRFFPQTKKKKLKMAIKKLKKNSHCLYAIHSHTHHKGRPHSPSFFFPLYSPLSIRTFQPFWISIVLFPFSFFLSFPSTKKERTHTNFLYFCFFFLGITYRQQKQQPRNRKKTTTPLTCREKRKKKPVNTHKQKTQTRRTERKTIAFLRSLSPSFSPSTLPTFFGFSFFAFSSFLSLSTRSNVF